MKSILIALVLLASVAAVAQTTTFKSTSDGFQVTAPTASFTELRAGTYGGSDEQSYYSVTVTTYTRELTKDDFLKIVAALADGHTIVTSRENLDVDGSPAVLRLWKTSTGKEVNWITFKGTKVYQITFASDREANQINFDKVNAFDDSFKFYGCFLPEGCK
jgi:hypothetical protein